MNQARKLAFLQGIMARCNSYRTLFLTFLITVKVDCAGIDQIFASPAGLQTVTPALVLLARRCLLESASSY